MKTKVAINGFGRVGRCAFKIAFDRDDIEVVAINDMADAETLAYLLKHDSTYGLYQHDVNYDSQNIIVDSLKIPLIKQPEVSLLPWRDFDVDVVIESTGRFTDSDKARAHITEAGAKKVVISAPAKGDNVSTVVIGVNEDTLSQASDVISNASCTTNCITPIMDIIDKNLGVDKAFMTTIHSYTSSQSLVDSPAKDLRESRAGAINIIPSSTGASVAAAQALPKLTDIFDGLSIRVSSLVVSLADFSILTQKITTKQEINELFIKLSQEPYYQGIISVVDDDLVSSDFIGNSHSAIVDLKLTNVVGGNLIKIVAWYDNEWAYSNRLVELVADLGRIIKNSNEPDNSVIEEAHISE